MTNPKALVCWEAQFGDFHNTAQVHVRRGGVVSGCDLWVWLNLDCTALSQYLWVDIQATLHCMHVCTLYSGRGYFVQLEIICTPLPSNQLLVNKYMY